MITLGARNAGCIWLSVHGMKGSASTEVLTGLRRSMAWSDRSIRTVEFRWNSSNEISWYPSAPSMIIALMPICPNVLFWYCTKDMAIPSRPSHPLLSGCRGIIEYSLPSHSWTLDGEHCCQERHPFYSVHEKLFGLPKSNGHSDSTKDKARSSVKLGSYCLGLTLAIIILIVRRTNILDQAKIKSKEQIRREEGGQQSERNCQYGLHMVTVRETKCWRVTSVNVQIWPWKLYVLRSAYEGLLINDSNKQSPL